MSMLGLTNGVVLRRFQYMRPRARTARQRGVPGPDARGRFHNRADSTNASYAASSQHYCLGGFNPDCCFKNSTISGTAKSLYTPFPNDLSVSRERAITG